MSLVKIKNILILILMVVILGSLPLNYLFINPGDLNIITGTPKITSIIPNNLASANIASIMGITTQITDNNYNDRSPKIDNGQIVWRRDDGNDDEIFLYDGTSITQLTDNNYDDDSPQIHNGQVTWNRNDGWDDEIFLYNGIKVKQITNNWRDDRRPQIHDGQIAYSRHFELYNEIMFYDGISHIRITSNQFWDDYPQIHNGQITWFRDDNHDWEIYFYNGSSTVQITNNNYDDFWPDIYNGLVTWSGDDGHDFEIFLYDSNTGITTQITNNNYRDYGSRIHNGQVTWYGWDGHDYEIFLYDSNTGITTQITNNNYDDGTAWIHNGQVTWPGWDGNDYEVFLYNGLSTTQITDNDYDDISTGIHNGQVTWYGWDGNDYEIFFLKPIVDLTPPIITIEYQDGEGTVGNPGKWNVFAYDDESGINEDTIAILIDGEFTGDTLGDYDVPNILGEHTIYVEVENNDGQLGSESHSISITSLVLLHSYDFEDDIVGQDPTGITLSVNDPAGSGSVNIDNLSDEQQNHVALHKSGGSKSIRLMDNLSYYGNDYNAGELHFKFYHDNSLFGIHMRDSDLPGLSGILFAIDFWDGIVGRYGVGITYTTYTLNQWTDLIIYYDISLGWMFEIDGVRFGDGYSFSFAHENPSGLEFIQWRSAYSGGGNGYLRIDDIAFYYKPSLLSLLHSYDFEDDMIGQDPTGITLSVNDPAGSGSVNIDNLGDEQQNHVALHKSGGSKSIHLMDNLSYYGNDYDAGELHFKFYHDSSLFGIHMRDSTLPGLSGILFAIDLWDGKIGHYGVTTYTSYTLNQWTELTIYYNISLGWMFEIDGVRFGDGYSYSFAHENPSGIEFIQWRSAYSGGGNGFLRIDDIAFYYEENTPAGSDVEVIDEITGINITFSEVTSGGMTTIEKSEEEPDPPSGFEVAGDYYDITTDASYSGLISLAIPYNETKIQGNEEDLKILHWEPSTGWMDVTIGIDTVNNIIYGESTEFSIFVVMEFTDHTPPVITIEYVDGDGTDENPGFWNVFAYDDVSDINLDTLQIFINGTLVGNEFGTYEIPNSLGEYIIYVEIENNNAIFPLLGSDTASINIIDDDADPPEISNLQILDDIHILNISFNVQDAHGVSKIHVYIDDNLTIIFNEVSMQSYFEFIISNEWIMEIGTHDVLIEIWDADDDRVDDSMSSIITGFFETSLEEMKQYVIWRIDQLIQEIQGSPDDSWRKKNYKATMINKLNDLKDMIPENDFEEAYDKLLHDIKLKLTGLKTDENENPWGNGVFKNPLATSSDLQEIFRVSCNEILTDITTLIQALSTMEDFEINTFNNFNMFVVNVNVMGGIYGYNIFLLIGLISITPYFLYFRRKKNN